jgi:hypothetical protein
MPANLDSGNMAFDDWADLDGKHEEIPVTTGR